MTFLVWYLITGVVLSLTCGYIGWRLITPADMSSVIKWFLWTVLFVLALLPSVSFFIDRIGYQGTSYFFNWAGYVGLGLISFLFTFVLARDLLLMFSEGGFKIFTVFSNLLAESKKAGELFDPERRRFLINASSIGIVGISSALTGYGIFEARRRPSIIELNIPIPGLPDDLEGVRIVQISDVHAGLTVKRNWIETIVTEVNNLSADIIAFTGGYKIEK